MKFSISTKFLCRGLTLFCLGLILQTTPAFAQSNFTVRVMASNITGNPQEYEAPQIRILQGLDPDVVAIQEFNYLNNSPAEIRSFVDTAFGTNFNYYRESGYAIPNGVISRWPIVSSGSWPDAVVGNRGFAWAQIDLPGSNDLYVVSVHLYASGNSTDRNNEAIAIKSNVQGNFPANAWVIVAGDMNTGSRTEPAITTFKTFLSDSPIPSDAVVGGDEDTNLNRNSPYDYVLPSFSMTNALTNVVIASQSFPKGLVFDSRVYTPLADVAPIQSDDSAQGQHMAVIKDFHVNNGGTNPPPAAPVITDQPDSLIVVEGSNAAFAVAAVGAAPLAYQWRFNETPLAGATNASYSRLNAQIADGGDYTVVVTNALGSVTSVVAVLTVLPPGGGGAGDVIAQWDFNDGTLNPSTGAGNAGYTGGATANLGGEFAGGSATDPTLGINQAWNTSTYPAQGTANKTAGVRFAVSTLGKELISVAWDVRASNTGSKYARLQYTTNGTTYFDLPLAVINPTSFGRRTNDLSGLAGVSDNTAFAFRIVAEFENTATGSGSAIYAGAGTTYGTSGTLRYDMVTVYGSPIAPPVDPPEITVQPLSQNQPEGNGLLLSVEATGTPPLNYQWYKDPGTIPGATNSDYAIGSTSTNDTGDYFVVVSGPSGAVTSSVASVVIYRPLNIITPFAGLTVIWGRDALLSVGATGSDPLGYQWYHDGATLGGATNTTLLIPGIQFSNAGLYSVVISSLYDQATNPPAPLVVIPADVSLGIYGNLAGLTITGAIANPLAISYTADLANPNAWLLATNLILQQEVELWLDESVSVASEPRRFYRVEAGTLP